jgi:methyl-accepting chemotaxis protein
METFNNLKVRTKLWMFVIAMLIALVITGVMGIIGMSQWSQDMSNFSKVRTPTLIALGNLNTERMAIRAQTVSVFQ